MSSDTSDWSDDTDDVDDVLVDDDSFLKLMNADVDDFTPGESANRITTAKQRLEEIMEDRQLRSNIASWDDWDTLLADNA